MNGNNNSPKGMFNTTKAAKPAFQPNRPKPVPQGVRRTTGPGQSQPQTGQLAVRPEFLSLVRKFVVLSKVTEEITRLQSSLPSSKEDVNSASIFAEAAYIAQIQGKLASMQKRENDATSLAADLAEKVITGYIETSPRISSLLEEKVRRLATEFARQNTPSTTQHTTSTPSTPSTSSVTLDPPPPTAAQFNSFEARFSALEARYLDLGKLCDSQARSIMELQTKNAELTKKVDDFASRTTDPRRPPSIYQQHSPAMSPTGNGGFDDHFVDTVMKSRVIGYVNDQVESNLKPIREDIASVGRHIGWTTICGGKIEQKKHFFAQTRNWCKENNEKAQELGAGMEVLTKRVDAMEGSLSKLDDATSDTKAKDAEMMDVEEVKAVTENQLSELRTLIQDVKERLDTFEPALKATQDIVLSLPPSDSNEHSSALLKNLTIVSDDLAALSRCLVDTLENTLPKDAGVLETDQEYTCLQKIGLLLAYAVEQDTEMYTKLDALDTSTMETRHLLEGIAEWKSKTDARINGTATTLEGIRNQVQSFAGYPEFKRRADTIFDELKGTMTLLSQHSLLFPPPQNGVQPPTPPTDT